MSEPTFGGTEVNALRNAALMLRRQGADLLASGVSDAIQTGIADTLERMAGVIEQRIGPGPESEQLRSALMGATATFPVRRPDAEETE